MYSYINTSVSHLHYFHHAGIVSASPEQLPDGDCAIVLSWILLPFVYETNHNLIDYLFLDIASTTEADNTNRGTDQVQRTIWLHISGMTHHGELSIPQVNAYRVFWYLRGRKCVIVNVLLC